MNRLERLLLTAVAVVGSAAAVLLLSSGTLRSQGPLTRIMTEVGTMVSGVEDRVVTGLRGSGRSKHLSWFEPLRQNPACLRAPAPVLLGAFDGQMPTTLDGVVGLERALGTTFPLIQLYTAWGDKPEQQFPQRLAQAIWALGSVPVITWEPWLVDFESRLHPHLPLRDDRDKGGLASIARGDYDFYVDAWAADAARFGKPLFVRLGHEMNDPYRYPWGPHNNAAEDFIAAWRRVVERFRAAGAHNVVWVWSPHVAYEGYEHFYPGDDVVDWVATAALNYGTVAYWSRWWTFDEIFGNKYENLAAFGKPIMVAELGSLMAGGERETWYREALANLPSRYPQVRAVLFFHDESDATVTMQSLDWSLTGEPALAETVATAIQSWPSPAPPPCGR